MGMIVISLQSKSRLKISGVFHDNPLVSVGDSE